MLVDIKITFKTSGGGPRFIKSTEYNNTPYDDILSRIKPLFNSNVIKSIPEDKPITIFINVNELINKASGKYIYRPSKEIRFPIGPINYVVKWVGYVYYDLNEHIKNMLFFIENPKITYPEYYETMLPNHVLELLNIFIVISKTNGSNLDETIYNINKIFDTLLP